MFLGCAFILSGCRNNPEQRSYGLESRVARSDSLFRQGKYLEAKECLRPFVRLSSYPDMDKPSLLKAYAILGDIHMIYEDFPGASHYYEEERKLLEAISDSDNLEMVDYKLLTAYASQEDHEKSERYLEILRHKAKGLKGEYYGKLGTAYYRKIFRSPDKSIETFRDVVAYVDKSGLDDSLKLLPVSEIIDLHKKLNNNDSVDLWQATFDSLAVVFYPRLALKDSSKNIAGQIRFLDPATGYVSMHDSLEALHDFMVQDSEIRADYSKGAENNLSSLKFELSYTIILILVIAALIIIGITVILRNRRNRGHLLLKNKDSNSKAQKNSRRGLHLGDPKEKDAFEALYQDIVKEMSKEENFSNPEFSLRMLAGSMGINANYISNAINGHGNNFRTLLNEFRIKAACMRLLDPATSRRLTIQGVSENVGFRSQSAFIRAFTRHTGQTPSEFLKKNRL